PGAAAPTVGRAKALTAAAGLADQNGQSPPERALGLAEQAAGLWQALGNDAWRAYALVFVAAPTYVIGRRTGPDAASDRARGILEEALGLAQRAGNRAIEAMILHQLGKLRVDFVGSYAYLRRDLSEEDTAKRAAAQQLMEQALAVATEAGYVRMRIMAL